MKIERILTFCNSATIPIWWDVDIFVYGVFIELDSSSYCSHA